MDISKVEYVGETAMKIDHAMTDSVSDSVNNGLAQKQQVVLYICKCITAM